MCAPVNRAKGSWRSTLRNFFSNSFECILCGVLKSLLLTDWILNGFLTHKPPTFTITLSITIFIHTTLLPRKVPIYTAVSIMIASLEQTICSHVCSLLGSKEETSRMQVVKLLTALWNLFQRAKHRKTLCFSQNSVGGMWGVQSSVTLTWALTTLGSFWVFSRYFYSPPLFYFFLIVFFSLSASFPALSVLCQMGSCCHRNHKCLWLPLSLFLFSSSAFLHVFLFFFLPCDKYLFPCHLRRRSEVWWGWLEWLLRS